MGLFEVSRRAKEELLALCAHPDHRGKGVRVFIEGMPHDEKTCWILMEDRTRPVDRIFIEDGITFIVGPESGWYLKGKELDYEVDEDGSGSFYLTPIPNFVDAWDAEEWSFLDDLPCEEEPWDDDEWELVADDEFEDAESFGDRPAESASAGTTGTGLGPAPGRLPRGWRPGP